MGLGGLVIIVAMLLVNSAFAAYELGLASLSLGQLKVLVDQRKPGAASALAMKARMEASLAVVQIGITLVGAIAAATGGAGAEERVSPWLVGLLGVSPGLADVLAIALVVLPLSAFTIIIGELVPKAFALRHSEWVCLHLSLPMRLFSYPVHPAVVAFEWLTRRIVGLLSRNVPGTGAGGEGEAGLNELRAQALMLRTARIIGVQQEQMILGASRLSKLRVRDIAIPPQEILMLSADGRLIEHLVTAHTEARTRFPVTERAGDPQAIVGYVTVKELFFLAKTHPENPSLREILRPLPSFAPDAPVGEAFTRMMADHVHLALVRDAEGRVHGMLTLEDILEEVVGDIQDEFDRLPRHVTASGRQWLVGGALPLSRLREVMGRPELGPDLPPGATVNDWLRLRQGVQPKGGTAYVLDGVRLLARKVRRQMLVEALIDPQGPGEPEGPVNPSY